MSRTYKDRPSKIKHPEAHWDFGTEHLAYESTRRIYEFDLETNNYCCVDTNERCIRFFRANIAGAKTKKPRHVDTEWHWMSTPGWYISEFMNRPQRAKGRAWEHKVVNTAIEDLDTLDTPSVGRKPHLYYW
jgi:hypothetical protein